MMNATQIRDHIATHFAELRIIKEITGDTKQPHLILIFKDGSEFRVRIDQITEAKNTVDT
jgi:hypothetical protein